MVIAVLIFRYCDNNRKKECEQEGIKEHRLYSQYFMAYMIGKQILKEFDINYICLFPYLFISSQMSE